LKGRTATTACPETPALAGSIDEIDEAVAAARDSNHVACPVASSCRAFLRAET
jgi:hypothetical protein